MTFYRISNTTSGVVLGDYEGRDIREALDKMAQDAGYTDYDDLRYVCSADIQELLITEIK